MGYDGSLAYTGVGMTIFGATFGLNWVIGLAIVFILAGALVYRYGARRKHRASQGE